MVHHLRQKFRAVVHDALALVDLKLVPPVPGPFEEAPHLWLGLKTLLEVGAGGELAVRTSSWDNLVYVFIATTRAL